MYRSYNKCYKPNNCRRKYDTDNKCCKKVEVCWEKEDKCCQQDNKVDNNCEGCVCEQLKKLDPATLLDLFLSSGVSFIAVSFLRLDPQNCCAYFLESATNTPLIIDCKKIDAIRKL